MKDPNKQFLFAFTIASAVSGVIGWMFMTFATVRYVDARYDQVEERLKVIDERTWEMSGRKDPAPIGMKQIKAGR